jgi:hypothetical protein
MGVIDKVRSFAETGCGNTEVIRNGLTYGDARELYMMLKDFGPPPDKYPRFDIQFIESKRTCYMFSRDCSHEVNQFVAEKVNAQLVGEMGSPAQLEAIAHQMVEELVASLVNSCAIFVPPAGMLQRFVLDVKRLVDEEQL